MGSKDIYFVEPMPPDALRFEHQEHPAQPCSVIDDPLLLQMLQPLLADRFHLKFHREAKAGDVYLLKRNEEPLSLNPATNPGEYYRKQPF